MLTAQEAKSAESLGKELVEGECQHCHIDSSYGLKVVHIKYHDI